MLDPNNQMVLLPSYVTLAEELKVCIKDTPLSDMKQLIQYCEQLKRTLEKINTIKQGGTNQ